MERSASAAGSLHKPLRILRNVVVCKPETKSTRLMLDNDICEIIKRSRQGDLSGISHLKKKEFTSLSVLHVDKLAAESFMPHRRDWEELLCASSIKRSVGEPVYSGADAVKILLFARLMCKARQKFASAVEFSIWFSIQNPTIQGNTPKQWITTGRDISALTRSLRIE